MAKKSAIENNNKKRKIVEAHKKTRESVKSQLKNKELAFEDRLTLTHKLAEMTRSASATRVRNRCEVTGRPRGYYRKFKMSRIALRELGSLGLIPGIIKASW
jgi:small subunit ribosomal protein S14